MFECVCCGQVQLQSNLIDYNGQPVCQLCDKRYGGHNNQLNNCNNDHNTLYSNNPSFLDNSNSKHSNSQNVNFYSPQSNSSIMSQNAATHQCHTCHESIQSQGLISPHNSSVVFHPECVQCRFCNLQINIKAEKFGQDAQSYKFYHQSCFLKVYSGVCEGCKMRIEAGSACTMFARQDKTMAFYHSKCAVCHQCHKSNSQYVMHSDGLLCLDCHKAGKYERWKARSEVKQRQAEQAAQTRYQIKYDEYQRQLQENNKKRIAAMANRHEAGEWQDWDGQMQQHRQEKGELGSKISLSEWKPAKAIVKHWVQQTSGK